MSLAPGTKVRLKGTRTHGEIVSPCGSNGYWVRFDNDDCVRFYFVSDTLEEADDGVPAARPRVRGVVAHSNGDGDEEVGV